MTNKIKMVVALGGNALQANPKDMTPQSQLAAAEETAKTIVKLLKEGYEFVLTHGNGPQVGQIIKTYEEALKFQKSNSYNRNDLQAFVIFSDDNKSADVFLPGRIRAFVISKDNYTLYQDNQSYYSIINTSEKLSLQENGTEIYFINR